jgi:hypothetical protein
MIKHRPLSSSFNLKLCSNCFPRYSIKFLPFKKTYTVNGIDEWIVTAITHCQPVTGKEDDIDIFEP